MTMTRPQLHSVWENRDGEKIFVCDISEPFTEEEIAEDLTSEGYKGEDFEREAARMREQFFVTCIAYEFRNDLGAIATELDNDEWADMLRTDGYRMIEIEPIAS